MVSEVPKIIWPVQGKVGDKLSHGHVQCCEFMIYVIQRQEF